MEAATGVPTAAPSRRVYVDFEPTHDLLQEEVSDTYVIHLAGFKKEQLRVQVKGWNLVITGERLLGGNQWSRFRKECQIPKTCKIDGIRARFDNGLLYVTLPKSTSDQQGKDELAKTTSSRKVDESKKEGTGLAKREESSTRMAGDQEKEKVDNGEKDKEKYERKTKEKVGDVADKKKHEEDCRKEGTALTRAESLVGMLKQKMGEMNFQRRLDQPKKLMLGVALAAAVSVGWYLHHNT